MEEEYVPMYRDAKTIKDLSYNMNELIRVFNHNSTSMAKDMKALSKSSIQSANDIKWIKRFIFGVSGIVGIIILGAVSSIIGFT